MKRLRKYELTAWDRSYLASFILCSFFLLAGALAGCYSGLYVNTAAAGNGYSAGTDFSGAFFRNMFPVAVLFLMGSSCIGFIIMPLLSAGCGFAIGFVLGGETALYGFARAAAAVGWIEALGVPFMLMLFTSAMRASTAMLRLLLFGVRPSAGTFSELFKTTLICTGAALLLAVLQVWAIPRIIN